MQYLRNSATTITPRPSRCHCHEWGGRGGGLWCAPFFCRWPPVGLPAQLSLPLIINARSPPPGLALLYFASSLSDPLPPLLLAPIPLSSITRLDKIPIPLLDCWCSLSCCRHCCCRFADALSFLTHCPCFTLSGLSHHHRSHHYSHCCCFCW